MRSVYLQHVGTNPGGSRGGVGSGYDDYALEIGSNQNADEEMLALCTLIDEIREFLTISPSPLAKMILHQWQTTTKELRNKLENDIQF